MAVLEQRFADYTVKIAAIEPATAQLRVLQAAYAHTYVLEDAYLSALANGLAEHKLDDLPNTQAGHRAAIIGWRTGLTVLADRAEVNLPAIFSRPGVARSPRHLTVVKRKRSALAPIRRCPSGVVGVQALDAARLAAQLPDRAVPERSIDHRVPCRPGRRAHAWSRARGRGRDLLSDADSLGL